MMKRHHRKHEQAGGIVVVVHLRVTAEMGKSGQHESGYYIPCLNVAPEIKVNGGLHQYYIHQMDNTETKVRINGKHPAQ